MSQSPSSQIPAAIFSAAQQFLEAANKSAEAQYEEYRSLDYNVTHIEHDLRNLATANSWLQEGRKEGDRLKSVAVTMQYGLIESDDEEYSRGCSCHTRTLSMDAESWVLKGGYLISDGESASDIRDPIDIICVLGKTIAGEQDLGRWLEAMTVPGKTDGPIVSASSF